MKNLERLKVIKLLILILPILLFSCRDQGKTDNLYAYPQWQEDVIYSASREDAFLFFTAELRNTLFPKANLKSPKLPKEMPHSMKTGGAAILKSYMNILRKRFGEKVAFLSYGDLDLRSHDNKLQSYLIRSLKLLNFDGLLLGSHDLLPPDHQSLFFDSMKKLPWFNSSILSIKTGQPTTQWNSQSYQILTVGKKKIGLIGITSYDLVPLEKRNSISGYYFQDPVSSILRTKNLLKKEGVEIISLFYQGKNPCPSATLNAAVTLSELPKSSDLPECKEEMQIKTIIDKLPPNAIDFVVGNNLPSFQYREIPIVGLQDPHSFLTGIRLSFTEGTIDWTQSFLLEPLKLCHETFVGTQDCVFDTEDSEINEARFDILKRSSYHMLPARFLGHEIKEDEEALKILNDR